MQHIDTLFIVQMKLLVLILALAPLVASGLFIGGNADGRAQNDQSGKTPQG